MKLKVRTPNWKILFSHNLVDKMDESFIILKEITPVPSLKKNKKKNVGTRRRKPGKSEVITLLPYKKELVGKKTKMNKSTKPVTVAYEEEVPHHMTFQKL